VSTSVLNKAVTRNIERFPEDFMFQLTREEFDNLKFHFGTSSCSRKWDAVNFLTSAWERRAFTLEPKTWQRKSWVSCMLNPPYHDMMITGQRYRHWPGRLIQPIGEEGDGHEYINISRGRAAGAVRGRMLDPTRLLWEC